MTAPVVFQRKAETNASAHIEPTGAWEMKVQLFRI
jgi:hypothetical protein